VDSLFSSPKTIPSKRKKQIVRENMNFIKDLLKSI